MPNAWAQEHARGYASRVRVRGTETRHVEALEGEATARVVRRAPKAAYRTRARLARAAVSRWHGPELSTHIDEAYVAHVDGACVCSSGQGGEMIRIEEHVDRVRDGAVDADALEEDAAHVAVLRRAELEPNPSERAMDVAVGVRDVAHRVVVARAQHEAAGETAELVARVGCAVRDGAIAHEHVLGA